MNKNFLNVMYPELPPLATHFITEEAGYFKANIDDNTVPYGEIGKYELTLQKNTPIILLEEGIGYKAQWSKILISIAEIAYVESAYLSTQEDFESLYIGIPKYQKAFFPYSKKKEFSPNPFAPKLPWKDQKINVVFSDENRGCFCINYEYDGVIKLESNNTNDLKYKIREACYLGTALILKSRGIRHDLEYVTSLVDNYYLFSKAEEFYFPDNPCSSLRVLVTLPMRYVYAEVDGKMLLENDKEPEDLVSNVAVVDESGGTSKGEFEGDTRGKAIISDDDNPQITKLIYNDKGELDQHFAYIMFLLSKFMVTFNVPPGRIWQVTPNNLDNIIPLLGSVDLLSESIKLAELYSKINEFIQLNLFEKVNMETDELPEDGGLSLGRANYKRILGKALSEEVIYEKVPFNTSYNITDLLSFRSTKGLDYKCKIIIYINKVNLELIDIKLEVDNIAIDNVKREIKLNIEKDAFLADESVKNKTSLNYLIQEDLKPSEIYKNLVKDYTTFSKDLTGFGNFVQKLGNALSDISKLGSTILETNQDSQLETFLVNYHFPNIQSVYAEPIDYGACIDKYGTTAASRLKAIKDAAIPENKIREYRKLVSAIKKEKEKTQNIFVRSLTDIDSITDPNFKILIGKTKPKGPSSNDVVNRLFAAANMLNWGSFLAESIKCSATKFSANDIRNVINDFEDAKALALNADLLLLCNPFVDKVLKEISAFELPELPTYDPDNSLIKQLEELAINTINELFIFGIRSLITGAIKDCASNPNDESGTPNPEDPNGITNPENPESFTAKIDGLPNDINAKSFLNETFGADIDDPVSQENARQKLKNFLDDVLPCLTVKEICLLATGSKVNDDIYDIILSIVRRKYNTPNEKYNLASVLNTRDSVQKFFADIGSIYDLKICDDILSGAIQIPANPRCDDGRRDQKYRDLLSDKGLTDDVIENLLKDRKEKDEADLKKVLDFLNNKNPFDLSNLPSVLCKKGPNGEVIPPAVSLAPSLKSFSQLLDTVYKMVYKNFDSEAPEWYKSTYSISSSLPKDHLSFDSSGNIISKPSKPDGDGKLKETQEAIPNYIFNSLLKNKNISYDISNKKITAEISGFQEQSLETQVVTKLLRDNIIKAEKELRNFLLIFLQAVDDYNKKIEENLPNKNEYIQEEEIKKFLNETITPFSFLATSFLVNNVSAMQDPYLRGLAKRVSKYKDSDFANAFFSEEVGLPIYKVIMDTYIDNSSFNASLKNLLDKLSVLLDSQIVKDSTTYLTNYKTNYTDEVKSKYVAVSKMRTKFPDFKVELINNLNIATQNTINDRTEIKDNYKLIVEKNGYQYFNFDSIKTIDNEVTNYLTSPEFGYSFITLNNVSKEDIFNKFISLKQKEFKVDQVVNGKQVNIITASVELKANIINDSVIVTPIKADYASSLQLDKNLGISFDAFKNNLINNLGTKIIKNSLFNKIHKQNLGFTDPAAKTDLPKDSALTERETSVDSAKKSLLPYTRYLSLIKVQSAAQKACNIFPHYLDIDSIKDDTKTAKEESYCLEEINNEKILRGEDVNTKDLSSAQPTETQFIMLNDAYRLLIRTYLHDYLLRGIIIFGIYDPQNLKNNEIFINFLTNMLEAELRASDNTLFLMMVNFFLKQYSAKNPELSLLPPAREIIKTIIKSELKEYVLPKLAKRIDVDTNSLLKQLNPSKSIRLRMIDEYYDLLKDLIIVDPESKGIFLRISGYSLYTSSVVGGKVSYTISDEAALNAAKKNLNNLNLDQFNNKKFEQQIYYRKIYQSKNTALLRDQNLDSSEIRSRIIREFFEQKEYKLLFDYLFSLRDELAFMYICSVLSTGTKKSATDSFRDTKKYLREICKKITTSGAPIEPDRNNFQDLKNNDNSSLFLQFILQALIKAPLSIVKGFAELTEPNLALSNTLFKLARGLNENVPSAVVPATSLALGIPIPPAFPLGIIPYINIPLVVFYLATGLWWDEKSSSEESLVGELLNKLTNNPTEEIDCSTVINDDKIELTLLQDNEFGYQISTQPRITDTNASETGQDSSTTATNTNTNEIAGYSSGTGTTGSSPENTNPAKERSDAKNNPKNA